MNRPTLLVLVILGLVALASWMLFGGGTTEIIDSPRGSQRADDGAPVDQTDSQQAAIDRTRTTEASAGRRAKVYRRPEESDPEIRAALAGFKGRLVDSTKQPVPDSLVQLFRFAPDVVMSPDVSPLIGDGKLCEPEIDAGEIATDAEGRFLLTGVWPRAFYLLKAGVGGDAQTLKIIQRTPDPGEIVDLGDIELETLGVITGTVVDADGVPVAGALVRAVDLPGAALSMFPAERFDPEGGLIVSEEGGIVLVCPSWVRRRFDQLPIASTESSSDGSFRLAGVIPGGNLVATTKRGLLSHVQPRVVVEAGEEKDIGRVRLREGEEVYGKVVDGEDEPIVGAEVLVAGESPAAPAHLASFAEPTDDEGVFGMTGLPTGNAVVAVRRGRGYPWTVSEVQPVTKDFVIRLESQHTLTLAVHSNAGQVIQKPEFQLSPGRGRNGAVEMTMWGVIQRVDLDDRLAKLEDGRYAIKNLQKGRYMLLTRAAGHALTVTEIHIEGDFDQEVALEANRVFDVQVLTRAGKPVKNASLYAEAQGEGPRVPDMPVNVGRTDAKGNLTVDAVSSTKVRLTAQHPAYGCAHAESEIPPPGPIILTFDEPGSIEGSLLENGQKPTPGKWFVYVGRKWDSGERGAMPDIPRITMCDLDGRFVLRGLRPGKYDVGVQTSLEALNSPGRAMQFAMQAFMMQERDEQDVIVVSGQVTDVTLDAVKETEVTGPSAKVTGTVMIDGVPAHGYVLQGWGENRRYMAEITPAGLFDLGLVKAGDVHLSLGPKPDGNIFSGGGRFERMWQRNFKIEDGKDQDVLIDIKTSGMSGTVTLPDGSPAANVNVGIQGQIKEGDSTNYVNFNERTDRNGRFNFSKIPAATYSLSAESDNKGRARLEDIAVQPSLPTTGIHLAMEAVVIISGSVDLSVFGNDRPEWMGLQFHTVGEAGEHSHHTQWVQIQDDGNFHTNDLGAGTYRVTLYQGGGGITLQQNEELVHPGTVTIGITNLENLVIRPVRQQRQR